MARGRRKAAGAADGSIKVRRVTPFKIVLSAARVTTTPSVVTI